MAQPTTIKASAYAAKEAGAFAVNEAKREAINALSSAENTVRETAERLGREARDVVDNVISQTRNVSGQVRTKVETQPVQSAMIALAAGMVLGFLFRGSK